MVQSIYDKYGGFASVNRVVLAFYDTILDHDDLGPFFDDIDMKALIDHQTVFISSLLGGPASFGDEHLRHAHKHLSITDADFDTMKSVLAKTLSDHGFAAEDVAIVIDAVEARRSTIIST